MNRAPSPPKDPVIGHIRSMRGDTMRFYADLMERYGDVVRLEFMNGPVHLLTHPDHVRRVLGETEKDFVKKTPALQRLKVLMGEGLVTATGDHWRRQRKLIQPLFRRDLIARYATVMIDAANEMLERFDGYHARDVSFDVGEEITRTTLRIVSEALLGADVRSQARAVAQAVTLLSKDVSDRMTSVFSMPFGVPSPQNTRFDRQIAVLFSIIGRIIQERRAAADAEGGTDLLTLLSRAKDEETGEAMSEKQLTDEVMTMFLAGHETTSSALAWTFMLLAENPRVRRALADEIDGVLGDRGLAYDDLAKMPLLERVIKEALRLYPPISHIPRRLVTEQTFDGYAVPAGSLVVVSPYATHRHSAFWENAEGFDPDRFLPENEAARPRYAYFPFGGGPRVCIGNMFSLIEMQIVVTMVTRRYFVDLVPGHPVGREMLFTLRPNGPVRATLKKRDARASA